MSKKKWFILACIGMLGLGMGNVNVVNAATLDSSSQEVSMIDSEEVFREGDFEGTVLEDGTLQVSYYPLEEVTITELTIPSEIDGKTVTSIGGVWDENVTQINIPDTINNIVAYAFSGSKKLETITVYGDAETMPALSIGDCVFNCESIEYIDEKLLTNVTYIGEYAFNAASISELNIQGNNIEVMGYAFGEHLEKLSIVGNNVVIHDYAFYAKNLEEISLQGVTELGEKAFERAGYIPYNNMIKMEISGQGFDFSKGDMQQGQFINLQELKLKGVEHIGDYAFDKCESLEVLEFADGLLSIGYANFNNTKLKEVALPNSVQELKYSFYGCLELEKVTTYGANISQSVDNKFAGFAGCTNLKELQIPKSIGQIGSISGYGGVDSLDSLESVIIPDGCVKIGTSAFEGCVSLETIVLPNSLSVIGQRAFYDCDSLKTIEFVGDTIAEEGLTLDTVAFGYCDNLKEIYLPSNTTIRIEYGVFRGCSNLEEVNLPEGVVEIGEYAFAYCEKLKAFNIPEKVKSIEEGTFVGCTALQEIIIPSTLTEFSEEVFCDDYGSPGDYELRAIIVEEGNPNYSTQDGILFNIDKTELLLYPFAKEEKSYIIPSSVIRIGKYAFAYCQLDEIEFPDKLQIIDDYAFYNSYLNMKELEFGNSLVKIGKRAFADLWLGYGGEVIIRLPSSLEYIGYMGLDLWVSNDPTQVFFYTKDCVIDELLDGMHRYDDRKWLIYGYPDSTAYTYAETYTIPFFDIETGEQLLPIVEATATPAPTVEPTATPTPTVSPTVTPVPTVEPIVTPIPTEAPSTTSFVTRMYQQCLSRDPDQAGLEGWVGQLENGNMDGAAIAEQFVFSQEMLDKNLSDEAFVDILYTSMMGRTADTVGKGGWVSQLSGQFMTRSEVTKAFVESIEFTDICSCYGISRGTYDASIAPIEHFVSRFYSLCLERNADQAGLYGWVGNLKNRYMNGAQIANAFFFSEEFVGRNVPDEKYVELLYNTLMGRPSDAAGKSGWVNQLQNGYMTREALMKAFIESPEFTGICESYGIVRGSL